MFPAIVGMNRTLRFPQRFRLIVPRLSGDYRSFLIIVFI